MKQKNTMARQIDLSIVTTAKNEEGNVVEFLRRSLAAFKALGIEGEIIFFDDASSDETYAMACKFVDENASSSIYVVKNPVQKGIVNAVINGTMMARGKFVCFLPSDLESLPDDDVPILYAAMDQETDVVAGWRQGRADNKGKASAIYNYLNGLLFGVRLHDANWIKLVRREKLQDLVLLSDWHSIFIGLLAVRGCRIKEVRTQWHSRKFGHSKFGARRFAHAIAAAISGKAYLKFGERPLLLFLEISAICVIISFASAVTAALLQGSNVVLVVLSFSFLILASISLSAGLSVEALRWGRLDTQIKLRDCDLESKLNNRSENGK